MRCRLPLGIVPVVLVFGLVGAQPASAAQDPLSVMKLPHKVKLVNVTGTRTGSWTYTADERSDAGSETLTAGLLRKVATRSAMPEFLLSGAITGNATSTDHGVSLDCGDWAYNASQIGMTGGLFFTKSGRKNVRVTLGFNLDPTKFGSFMTSYGNSVCDGAVLGTGHITDPFVTHTGSPACDGADMCTTIKRAVLSKKIFKLRFRRTEQVDTVTSIDAEHHTYTTDLILTFKRI